MAIKIIKDNKNVRYRSSKKILTTADIKEADQFDLRLKEVINEIESALLDEGLLGENNKKSDPLRVWYVVGSNINKFLDRNELSMGDEDLFWQYLYGRSSIINRSIPQAKSGNIRHNDFKLASLLAKLDPNMIKKINSWAIWREILGHKSILQDKRILKWTVDELVGHPRTRDEARPFLQKINLRFRNKDTRVLTSQELITKLKPLEL